ncbi:hypothetical protein QTP88_010510 [Uroleucon formosanum]
MSNMKKTKKVTECQPESTVVCKCSYECKRLTIERIKTTRKKFATLSYKQQADYLLSRLTIVSIQRRRKSKKEIPDSSRRQCSVKYTVPGDQDLIQVCKRTFMRLFSLSNSRLQLLIEYVKKGEISFVSQSGKNPKSHEHRRKYGEESRNSVIMHVMQFPREESHYSRPKNSKEFLSPDLNISRLYNAYKLQYPDSNISIQFYRRTFRKYFPDLSFRRPRTDTCMTCDRFQMKVKEKTTPDLNVIKEKELHLRKAEKAKKIMFNNMKDAQEPDSNMLVLSLDLEKVLFVPTLTHSQMYYSRQLSVYNLCLHVGDTKKSYMCVWHEGVASRGANEIGSCLIKVATSGITTKKNIQIWCDNCAGQNKNKMFVLAMIYLVANGWYNSVECRFLVSGHSFMPCDQDFAVIEKRKKLVNAMVPSEIEEMIKTSKLTTPFTVVDIEDGDIFDLNLLAKQFLNTTKMGISNVTGIKVTMQSLLKGSVSIKRTYGEIENWTETKVAKRGVNLKNIPTVLPKVKTNHIIDEKKAEDLLRMLEFMDPKYRDFYTELCSQR